MAPRLVKGAEILQWERPAEELVRQVHAFAPKPGAYTMWDGQRVKILQAKALPDASLPNAQPGTVFTWENLPAVVTGEGALLLLHLQMAGKRPMEGDIFLRGQRTVLGAVLTPPQAG